MKNPKKRKFGIEFNPAQLDQKLVKKIKMISNSAPKQPQQHLNDLSLYKRVFAHVNGKQQILI